MSGNLGGVVFIAILLAVGIGPWFVPVDPQSVMVGRIISGICIVGALGLVVRLWLMIRGRLAWLEVDPAGLRWSQRGQESGRPWKDVKTVWRLERLVRGTPVGSVRVDFRDGDPLLVDRSLSGYDEIADAIQSYGVGVLRAIKESELAMGEVEFGPVKLLRDGILHEGRELRWADVDYGIVRGSLWFVPTGAVLEPDHVKASILLETIPDYLLLLELMERHGKPAAVS
jgi:hypothetical protein